MKCPRCQAVNQDDAHFCEECGARLGLTCPSCGAPIAAGKKFCRSCGTALTAALDPVSDRFGSPQAYTPKHLAERILLSKEALEGERKQVTVLFADLKGSMELLADRDPEEARKLLDPVLERMMEAVHHFEGTVNQVMGDGIMALFGAPVAHEDHAVRACYAALRMQDQVSRYGDEMQRRYGTPIQLRVGLNSGEVVVRAIGTDLHMDYSAIGQTTHLAARMEQMAKPGTALITANTLKLAEGYVQVRPLGPAPVKGLTDAVEVYELTGASAARTRLQASAVRGLTRFVGRQRELEVLAEALASAERGKGQVGAIVGEPGVGKSRLFWEFIRSHRTHGWLVVEAGSVSYGKATPYLPVINLLKTYFKIGDRDDARSIREKVTGKLLALDRALEPLLSPLLALLDQPVDDANWQRLDPPQRRRQTLDALKRLWLREAQAQPLILVFEDLHWIDSETQEFLNGLLESIPTAHLLLLFNYRPEYHHPWGSKTYYTQLRLDPLTAETAEDLLGNLLGADPQVEPLKKMLVERTEGNPFFLEESVRTLVESKALGGERGSYRLLRPLERVEVPETVQAVLAARIDRLVAEDKRLLQTAAVVGKDVPFALLQAVAELPGEDLRSALSRLQAAEFLYEASLFPDLEYTFKHALTHDVAYGTLLQERRRVLHARILEAMDRLYAGRHAEQIERLAHHALRAEAWEKALGYLRQAGEKAMSRSANREAAAALDQALTALQHMPQRRDVIENAIDLRLSMRIPLVALGEYRRILDITREAESLARKIDDPLRLGWLLVNMSSACSNVGEHAAAVDYGTRAVAIAERLRDPQLEGVSMLFLGLAQHLLGFYRTAIETMERGAAAAQLAASMDAPEEGPRFTPFPSKVYARYLRAWTLGFWASALAETGAFDKAQLCGREAVQEAEAIGIAYALGGANNMLGHVHLCKGEIGLATPLLERCLSISRTADVPNLLLHVASRLGRAYGLAGRVSEAVALLETAIEFGRSIQDLVWTPIVQVHLAEAYGLSGRTNEAVATAQGAVQLARQHKERGFEAWGLYILGGLLDSRQGASVDRAADAFKGAVELATECGMRPLTAHCHLGLGQLHATLGDAANAREHLGRALALYREMEMHHWPEQAEAALHALN